MELHAQSQHKEEGQRAQRRAQLELNLQQRRAAALETAATNITSPSLPSHQPSSPVQSQTQTAAAAAAAVAAQHLATPAESTISSQPAQAGQTFSLPAALPTSSPQEAQQLMSSPPPPLTLPKAALPTLSLNLGRHLTGSTASSPQPSALSVNLNGLLPPPIKAVNFESMLAAAVPKLGVDALRESQPQPPSGMTPSPMTSSAASIQPQRVSPVAGAAAAEPFPEAAEEDDLLMEELTNLAR